MYALAFFTATGNKEKPAARGTLDDMFVRPMSNKEREAQHTRYVIMCCVDMRPFSMAFQPGFRYFVGGFLPRTCSQPSTTRRWNVSSTNWRWPYAPPSR